MRGPLRWLTLALLLHAGGCELAIQDGSYSCAGGAECPPGFECADDRLCYREAEDAGGETDAGDFDAGDANLADAAIDGGEIDAAVSDGGPHDAGPEAGVDAGCVDGDGDGFCAGVGPGTDCDDRTGSVSPGATELCSGDGEGRDDDCNGRIDESCAFHLGLAHTPFTIHAPDIERRNGFFFGPELSLDGLDLYFSHFTDATAPLYVASRPDFSSPFGEPTPLPGTVDTSLVLALATFAADALYLVVQASADGGSEWRLYEASRPDASQVFGGFSEITALSTGDGQFHPTLSRDGLELYYTHTQDGLDVRRLRVSRRASRNDAFGAGTVVQAAMALDVRFPRIWEDGLTLLLRPAAGAATRIMTRGETSQEFGSLAVWEDAPTGDPGFSYYLSAVSGELWYSGENGGATAAARHPLYRMQVCRSEACPALQVSCAPADTLTPSGLSCFHQTAAAEADAGRTSCRNWGGVAASIMTGEESDAIQLQSGFLGLTRVDPFQPFEWSNGLPLLHTEWDTENTQPGSTQTCASKIGALWSEASCEAVLSTMCERRLWPVFAP